MSDDGPICISVEAAAEIVTRMALAHIDRALVAPKVRLALANPQRFVTVAHGDYTGERLWNSMLDDGLFDRALGWHFLTRDEKLALIFYATLASLMAGFFDDDLTAPQDDSATPSNVILFRRR